MILSLSSFQLLPLHIVEAIVRYVLTTYHDRFDTKKQVKLAFAHSCHIWREVYKKQRCTNLLVEYKPADEHSESGNKGRFSLDLQHWSDILGHPQFPLDNLVKAIKFKFQYSQVLSEPSFMQCFLDSGYAALLLTSARTLDIDFDCRGHILNDSRISTSEEMSYFVQNILEFFNYIRQIAPNIKGVSVQWESIYTKTEGLDDDSTFSNVILKLAKGMSDVSLYGYMNPKAIGRYVPDAFSGLAALSYASRDSEMGLEIIRINAKTLQRLVIIGMADACVNRLFYHEDNSDEPIIYPSLKKLTLYCNDHLVSQPVREHVCHFPKLESIRLDGSYPALSSIFFNENKTLKDTGFSVRHELVNRVSKENLFEACALRLLEHLSIEFKFTRSQLFGSYSRYIDSSEAVEYLDLLIQKLHCLRKLTLSFFKYEKKIVDLLAESRAFANIQRLDFQMYNMSFGDIARILANTPLIEDFRCCPIRDRPSIGGIDDKDLIRHVQSDRYPLSRFLAKLFIHYGHALYVESTCQTLALLAAGCPRLSVVESNANYRHQLIAGFDQLAQDQSYALIIERLENLFTKA